MADRFPLILNTSTNQIQEIPSGDNLDLTGVNINNVGVITCGNVRIGTGTTDLVVTGDARITGILTIGTSSLKLDGPNNLVNVGTALTLGHTQGVQFHTQNLHSAGFEVNQVNASGIITATEADINGDIDVDGHTNLDNVSIAGVTTFASNVFLGDDDNLYLGASNDLRIYHAAGAGSHINNTGLLNIDGTTGVRLEYNNATRVHCTSTGVTIGGDLDVDAHTNLDNVSIAGVCTATSFVGDGSNLTGITQTTINNNADNRIITGSGTANTLEAESGLTYNGTSLSLAGGDDIRFTTGGWTGEHAGKIQFHDNRLYFQGGSNGFNFRDTSGATVVDLTASGAVTGKNLTISQDVTFNGVTGAVTVAANSDIRLDNGNWTGNYAGKIQHHDNKLYIQGGSSGIILRDNGNNNLLTLAYNSGGSGYCDIDGQADGFAFAKDCVFNGSAGAVTIGASSDIRFTTGNWTGEHPKIQLHGDLLYIQGGTHPSYSIAFRDIGGSDRFYMDDDGHLTPATNNTYDLGNSSYRWRNIYTNDLNLSNKGGANDVDNTWGDYTIQEGESDLFLINNRNGKKYKFNLTEVS